MNTLPTLTLLPISSYPSYSPSIDTSSVSYKLGRFARHSINYFRSKEGKRKALQAYIITEALISVISIISMLLAQIYLPAILLSIMLAYLVYASFGAF